MENSIYKDKNYIYTKYLNISSRKTEIDWDTCGDKIVKLSNSNSPINLELLKSIKKKVKSPYVDQHPNLSRRSQIFLDELNGTQTENKSNQLQETKNNLNTTENKVDFNNPDIIFWGIVGRIRWFDKDESLMTKSSLIRINHFQLNIIMRSMIDKFIPELKDKLDTICLLESLSEDEHNNIMSHIIMKGRQFYDCILACPEISLYLAENYYPAYKWIAELLNEFH
jgi:hypothetical protein